MMEEKQNKLNRRNFMKGMGVAGLGSVLSGSGCTESAQQISKTKFAQIPRRTLGKTGEKIPCVGLGTVFDMTNKQHVLAGSLDYGMYYWDTATNYGDTKSQLGIGQYLAQHPDVRKRLFLISKPIDLETPLPVIADFDKDLAESMERLHTDYFDAYCAVHGLSDPAQLTDELKRWAEKCKKKGLFKYIGYSAHENMAQGLLAAAKCGWIDIALVAYNFQLMQDDEYQRAIDAAYKAGIGLVAIKTQRKTTLEPMPIESEADRKLTDHFLAKGFTAGQAKLKVVLEDERFTAAAVGIDDVGILTANVAAAVDKTKLTKDDKTALSEYARATCNGYCLGCGHICRSAVPEMPHVCSIMRYMMYYNSYGHRERARQHFARIPEDARKRLLNVDYSLAQARCPQHLPISKIVAEAASKLA
jgi:predicted aldo/keto reductase-like oxidoreductase